MQLELVLLDAGNTVVFLDHDAVADIATSHGHAVDARVLREVEGVAKRRYETLLQQGVSHEDAWGLYLRALLEEGGLEAATALSLIVPLRRAHDAFNLWRRVPPDLRPALALLRAAGIRVAIVSNSEGKLAELFLRVGLEGEFETIVDSFFEGVRKPDPEIFHRALRRLNVPASRAIYLGDIPGVDIDGAHAAGLQAALVDALDFYPEHTQSPRFPSVAAWASAHLACTS